MDEHAEIELRSGPAGHRPGLIGGPDIWEVAAVHRGFNDVKRTADWLDQPTSAIDAALRYYDVHRHDIDEWIKENETAAERAWLVSRQDRP